MNRQKRAGLTAAAMAIGLTAAGSAAAEGGWYFSLSGGATSVDIGEVEAYDAYFLVDMQELVSQFGASVVQFNTSSLDDGDKMWGVQIGYRFNSYVAAEVGFLDLGQATYEADVALTAPVEATSDARYTSRGVTVSVLGLFPIGERLDVHVRGGMYFAATRLRLRSLADGFDTTPDPVTDLMDDDIRSVQFRSESQDLMGGAGITWNIGDGYSLRVEYQRLFDVGDSDDQVGESDVDLLSLTMMFR